MLCLGFFVFLTCVGLFTLLFFQAPTVFPIYATEVYGISTGTLGWLLGLSSLLLVFVQIPFVELVKQKNPYLIASGGILVFCWAYGLLPFGETLGFLLVLTLVRALGSMVIFPKIMGILLSDFDHGHPRRKFLEAELNYVDQCEPMIEWYQKLFHLEKIIKTDLAEGRFKFERSSPRKV